MSAEILKCFVALLLGLNLVACSSEEQVLVKNADQQSVESAIAEASDNFANDIQRTFLGRRASAPRNDVHGYTNIDLRDSVLTDSRGKRVAVTNVAITSISPLFLTRFKPDIQKRIAEVSAYTGQIVLAATYESSEVPNVTSNLIVTFHGASQEGKAGLQINGANFEASNFRLNSSYGYIDFHNVASNNEKEEANHLRHDSAVAEIFQSYYDIEIRSLEEKLLKKSIDDLLHDYKVSDIFYNSPEAQRSFRSLAGQRDDSINQLVDLILFIYKQHLIQEGKTYIPGPDLHTTFQEKFFGVPVTGTIAADNGFVGDLSTVYRTRSFSLDGNLTDSEFTLFGALGLSNLNVKYNRYKVDIFTFHPTGSLTASFASNSIYFEVTASLQSLKLLTVKKYDIRVQELENIKVQMSGMGEALDWLLSKVVTWAIDSFKPKIVEAVQNNIRNIIDKQLDKMGWQVPLA